MSDLDCSQFLRGDVVGFLYRVRAPSSGWIGGPGLNTFYFDATGDGSTGSDAAALLCVDRVHDAFNAQKAIRPGSWHVDVSPIVDVLQDTNGALMSSLTVAAPASVVGTGDANYNATAVMMLLKLLTTTISDRKRIQGRAFLGPISRFGDPDGTPDVGLINAVEAMGDALLDVGIGGGPHLMVWRRPRAARALPTVLAARDGSSAQVISHSTPNKYAILRTRRD